MFVVIPCFTFERVTWTWRLHLLRVPPAAVHPGAPALCGYSPSGGWSEPDSRLKLTANCKRCLAVARKETN